MQFDAESCMLRMWDALQNPGNKIEGGFCMDNIRAVAEEISRFSEMKLRIIREQIINAQEDVITSGNENHYVYWAKQVHGVGNARAVAKRDGSGIVYVSVITDKANTPDEKLLVAVSNYIETKRPVGAKPIIIAAEAIQISIEVSILTQSEYEVSKIKKDIEKKLQEWLLSISFSNKLIGLSYARVGSLLFEVQGIDDVLYYTINGARESIEGSYDHFFCLVIISASS